MAYFFEKFPSPLITRDQIKLLKYDNVLSGENKSNVDIGISTTGISGPEGGTDKKPIGLIYIAIAGKKDKVVKKFTLIPNRSEHREVAVQTALNMLRSFIK